uniref:Odorant receptor n=1 Tax=Aphidius gifuensis TaxID=684658 RepID=A0A3S9LW86_APHGI|nr:odorant receptor [Aphidius gifuensis]
MSILESPDFLLSKRILKLYGQWPYSSGVINYIKRIYCFVAVISILIPKLIKIYESRHDVDAFILCMPMVAVHIEAIINLTSWCTSGEEIKYLIETIKRDWDILKSGDEIAILDGHWKRGRSNINNYAYPMVGITLVFMTSPAIPLVCDIIAPLNESRPRVFLYETEYFVDQDEYYFHILIHAYMTVPISVGLVVLYNTVFGSWIHHAMGMLAIVAFIFLVNRYQLETIHDIPESDERFSQFEKNQSIQKRLAHYIKLHNDAIEFIETVESSSSTVLFIVVIGSTLVVTVTGTAAVIKMNHINESSRYMSFSIGTLGHLYYMSYVGNQVIKASESINQACYASEWYTLPIKCQKILIPIMVRTTHPCTMTAGKLYVLSMDNFSELVKKAMSLFTFINSTTH